MTSYLTTPLLLLAFLLGIVADSQAQRKKDLALFPHHNELTVGMGIQARGWNYFNLTYGWINRPQRTMIAMLELAELKHVKERRHNFETLSLSGNSPKSFIYGKQNNFYVLRMGVGERRYFSDKQYSKTVAAAFTYAAGPSLGLIKPYYLDLIYRNDMGVPITRPEAFNQNNQLKFLSPNDVDGASGFQYGWDDVSLNVGGFAKAGILLDWGSWDNFVKSMELGISVDFYFRKIPILIAHKNPPLFVNLYANFYIGRRW